MSTFEGDLGCPPAGEWSTERDQPNGRGKKRETFENTLPQVRGEGKRGHSGKGYNRGYAIVPLKDGGQAPTKKII